MELEIFYFKKCPSKLDLIESHIMESYIQVKVALRYMHSKHVSFRFIFLRFNAKLVTLTSMITANVQCNCGSIEGG